jgi:monoamine oxidase
MNFNNDNEVLDFFNRLLELLHQVDLQNFGSNIQLVYVASGAQHVDHIQTQYFGETHSTTLHPVPQKHSELPEALASPQAMLLWQKAQQAGYVDEYYQPLLSRTQAALLAHYMAKKLEIKDKWKTFEVLWNRRNMYRDYYDAMNQDQTYLFLDKLKELFE